MDISLLWVFVVEEEEPMVMPSATQMLFAFTPFSAQNPYVSIATGMDSPEQSSNTLLH